MKVDSKRFPKTNIVPGQGSLVEVASQSIVDDSWDTLFLDDGPANIFTSSNVIGGVTVVEDRKFETLYGTASGVVWGAPVSVDIINDRIEMRSSMHINAGPSGDFYDNVNRLTFNDNTDALYAFRVLYERVDGFSRSRIRVEEYGQNTFLDIPKTEWIEFSVVFAGDLTFHIGYRVNREDRFTYVTTSQLPSTYTANPGTVNEEIQNRTTLTGINLDFESSTGTTFTVGAAEFNPVLEGVRCKTFHELPECITKVEDGAVYYVPHAYPGEFNIVLNGIGSHLGLSDQGVLECLDYSTLDDSIKFVTSPVSNLYDDANSQLLCRQFAREGPGNRGNMIANMQCFCDGSAQDGGTTSVVTTEGGSIGVNVGRGHHPRFMLENDGALYGENFDMQRIHDDTSLAAGDDILRLRSTKLSDQSRVYFGVQGVAKGVDEQVLMEFEFEDPTSGGWTGGQWKITGVDNTTDISSANPVTAGPGQVSLKPGVYEYTVENADGGVFVGALVDGNCLGRFTLDDRFIGGWGYGADDVEPEFKIRFEVKQNQGDLITYVFDKCAGQMSKYETATGDVSLVTGSVSAVETVDGNVAVFYQGLTDGDVYGSRSRVIKYKILDVDTGVFSQAYSVNLPESLNFWLPGDWYTHAFDVVQTDDGLDFILSVETDERGFDRLLPDGSTTEEWARYMPFLKGGFFVVSVDKGIESGGFDATDPDSVTQVPLESVDNMHTGELESDTLFSASGRLNSAAPGFIDAGFDIERGETVLSVLSHLRRAPMVVAGKGARWNEVAFPYHFDLKGAYRHGFTETQGEPGTLVQTGEGSPTSAARYTGITSLSASYGSDGMVYSIATCGRSYKDSFHASRDCEIGVIDPEISVDSFIYLDGNLVPADSATQYRFETLPFLCSYEAPDGSSVTPISASIKRDDHYLVASFGIGTSGQPIIYQSGHQDTFPFGFPLEEVLLKEADSASGFTSPFTISSNVEYSPEGYQMPTGLAGGSTDLPSSIARQFEPETDYNDMAHKGYRASAVVEASGVLTEPYLISVEATTDEGSGLTVNAFIEYDGSGAVCRVIEPGGISDGTVIGSFANVGTGVQEYSILVQAHDIADGHQRAKVMFVRKTGSFMSANGYDYRVESEVVEGVVLGDIGPPEKPGSIEISSGENTNAGTAERLVVKQFGWSPLSHSGYTQSDSILSPDGTTIVQGRDNEHYHPGDRWRRFDDSNLFGSVGNPYYGYRMASVERENRSFTYHWPNGFRFDFSKRYARKRDLWFLDRRKVTNVGDLDMGKIHGMYTTMSDTEDVLIWADAQDSDLGKFDVDTFIVTGCNIPEVDIIVKDAIGDPWTTIGKIDLRKYDFKRGELQYTSRNNKGVIHIDSADIDEGRFQEFQHYHYFDGYRAAKVGRSSGPRIWLEEAVGMGDGPQVPTYVFADRSAEVLDSVVSHRFIGIRLKAFDTYEGFFKLHAFDFGRVREIPLLYNYDRGSGMSYLAESDPHFVFDEQPYSKPSSRLQREFELEFSLFEADMLARVKTTAADLSLNRKPIWVLEDNKSYKEKVHLCFVSGDVEWTPLVDEDGDSYYKLSFNLRSSE